MNVLDSANINLYSARRKRMLLETKRKLGSITDKQEDEYASVEKDILYWSAYIDGAKDIKQEYEYKTVCGKRRLIDADKLIELILDSPSGKFYHGPDEVINMVNELCNEQRYA